MAEMERLLEPDTAGDPIRGLRWTRRTTAKIAAQLLRLRIRVSARTVARLLRKLHFSLRVNRKKIGPRHPLRDAQFAQIHKLRRRFCRQGNPVISVDAKKRELVGNFKNPGTKWDRTPAPVNDHDFRSQAQGVAILYGIYDPEANRGALCVGSLTKPPPSPSPPSAVGGSAKDGCAITIPNTCSFWLTPAGAIRPRAVPGRTNFNSSVTALGSPSLSPTIRPERRNTILSSAVCSVPSAETGRASRSKVTRRS